MASKRQIGLQVATHRVNAGLTPEDLGAKVGVSGMTIRRIEKGVGHPTVRTCFLIAQELGLDAAFMFGTSPQRAPA